MAVYDVWGNREVKAKANALMTMGMSDVLQSYERNPIACS